MILASVCMRGGSKGVVGKNTRDLLGRPLMLYTFDCAKKSNLINEIAVSTDSDEILHIAKQSNIDCVFRRNENLATDDASKWEVFKDLVLRYEDQTRQRIKYLVDLDVTVPRRKVQHIDSSIDMMINNDVDVVITGYEPERNPYFNMMELNDDNTAQLVKKTDKIISCRQNAPLVYSLTPAVYVIKRNALFEYSHWADAVCMINPIPREFAIDIDTELDFQLVEYLMQNEQKL